MSKLRISEQDGRGPGWRAWAAMGSAILLAGCGCSFERVSHGGNPFTQEADMAALRAAPEPDTPFAKAMAQEYLALAEHEEVVEYDWFDSGFYARKGYRAASGDTVEPENPALWRLSAEDQAEILAARGDLMTFFAKGARDRLPAESAAAQARLDCWIEEQEEGWQTGRISGCREGFEQAFASLQIAFVPAATDPAVSQAEQSAVPDSEENPDAAAIPRIYSVFFEFDSAAVTGEGSQILDGLLEDWGQEQADFEITGHADRMGSESYNQRLSERRAATVRDLLVSKGIAGYRIETIGAGETSPLVETDDGVKDSRNRRAVVNVK